MNFFILYIFYGKLVLGYWYFGIPGITDANPPNNPNTLPIQTKHITKHLSIKPILIIRYIHKKIKCKIPFI